MRLTRITKMPLTEMMLLGPAIACDFTLRQVIGNGGTISRDNLRANILYQDASGGNVTMNTLTGPQMTAAFPDLPIGQGFAFYVASNNATNTSTITPGASVTGFGSMAVINTGGAFAFIKTAANAWELVRIG